MFALRVIINSFKQHGEFKLTREVQKDNARMVMTMKGKKSACVAMIELTGEETYKLALDIVKNAIEKGEKVIKLGVQRYEKDSKVWRRVQEFQDAQAMFIDMMMWMDVKMMPSRVTTITRAWSTTLLREDAEEIAHAVVGRVFVPSNKVAVRYVSPEVCEIDI